ncbi:helix-turn-helix domain-containing protein [Halobacillus litoralis]|uniref:helix-turn-helix domain-containing protein n=1 Tax=Halobacillus litoralis TaxID=45668 RepID=UPI0013690778|nr:helix-turn-helix domain-containing protein [Halobacillus litoralis]MYL39840.1 helix-turn-helix domain-containing protein [Halobacillus litoralis]
MKEWKTLIEKSQNGDEYSTVKIIKRIEPKIKKSLKQTTYQDRENLEQELISKTLKVTHSFDTNNVPGFWEFLSTNN